jgi:hypothetical protein
MQTKTITKRFYKEAKIWYIDLPEFLEMRLGTKANLMMVDGADEFLDFLSNNGDEVWIEFSSDPFDRMQFTLISPKNGMNNELLQKLGHAPVAYGMYYAVKECENNPLWLCPVTEYVFGENYPREIYLKVICNDKKFNLSSDNK